MSITITVPNVTTAVLTPNPASINASVTAALTITETTKTLYERYQHCGTARSGGRF